MDGGRADECRQERWKNGRRTYVVGRCKNADWALHERRRTPGTVEGLYIDVIRSGNGKIFPTFLNVLQRSVKKKNSRIELGVGQERCSV